MLESTPQYATQEGGTTLIELLVAILAIGIQLENDIDPRPAPWSMPTTSGSCVAT